MTNQSQMTGQQRELIMLNPVMKLCGIYSPDIFNLTESCCPECDGEMLYENNNDITLNRSYHGVRCFLYHLNGTTIHCDGVMIGKY